MATVTKPPILDETGQAIVTALGNVSIRPQIVDNLTTADANKALSANMGNSLKTNIDGLSNVIMTMGNTLNNKIDNMWFAKNHAKDLTVSADTLHSSDTDGLYLVGSNSYGCPDSYGHLISLTAYYTIQIYIHYAGGNIWIRSYIPEQGGFWNQWIRNGFQISGFDNTSFTSLNSNLSIGAYSRGRITNDMILLHLDFDVSSPISAWTNLLSFSASGITNYAESFGAITNYQNGENASVFFSANSNVLVSAGGALAAGKWRGDMILFRI